MVTLRIAFRNIFRQKRRTIFTSLTMIVGFALASISIGWADGTYSQIINMFTRNRIGHIQIHHKGYLDEPSLYKTIDDYESIVNVMKKVEAIVAWSPRVNSAGLSSVGEESSGVQIIGIDPQEESRATGFHKKLVSGHSLSAEAAREAVIGKGLGEILKADIGDDIVIISQGADGSIANDLYGIVGVAESGDDMSDRMSCYLHIKDAQELLVLGERIHEVVIIVSDLDEVESATDVLREALHDRDLEVTPWQAVASSFYKAMKADKQGMWIMLFVVVLIVAVEVLNTVLMSVLERTREYGLLKAIGTRPNQVFRLVLYESFILAAVSMVVGAGVGTLGNHILSVSGISLSEPFTYGGVEFQEMRSEITAQSLYIPAIVVILSAVIVSIFPAIRAARTASAKSMRMH